MVTRLPPPHAIAVRLHVRKSNVVILAPETAVTVGVLTVVYPCRSDFPSRMKPWMLPGPCHRGPCGRCLLAPLTGNKQECKGPMVLRIKPSPTRFPTNSLYTPMDNAPLHSISSVCHLWGLLSLFERKLVEFAKGCRLKNVSMYNGQSCV